MRFLFLPLALLSLTSCNGMFRAGYMIETEWNTQESVEFDSNLACVDVNEDNTYIVDNQSSVS